MTTTATPAAPPENVNDLLPGLTSTGGEVPRAQTAAADAAAELAATAGAATGPEGEGPKIGRASPRAKAGFNSKKSKEELIRLGRELANDHAALQEQLAQLRGAGEGAPAAASAAPVDPSTLVPALAMLTSVLGRILAASRGDHWAFTDEEQTKLAQAGAPLLAKKAPALGEHLDTFVLVMTVAELTIPRLEQDRKLKEARQGGGEVVAPSGNR